MVDGVCNIKGSRHGNEEHSRREKDRCKNVMSTFVNETVVFNAGKFPVYLPAPQKKKKKT